MDLIESLNFDLAEVTGEVETALERENPEEVKVIAGFEGVMEKEWSAVWCLIGLATMKGFEMGFKFGQQAAGKKKPSPVRWIG